MIYIVMGMSKSGTTLVSKTLHDSGINMHPGKIGNYKQSKYEDPEIVKILLEMFGTNRLQSLFIPEKIKFDRHVRDKIKKLVVSRKGDWGFKQPWVTLVYSEFKSILDELGIKYTAIGIKRTFKGLVSHWTKRGKTVNEKKLHKVWSLYNQRMKDYGIPVISFEYFIKNGPKQLEKIVGRKLKDVSC